MQNRHQILHHELSQAYFLADWAATDATGIAEKLSFWKFLEFLGQKSLSFQKVHEVFQNIP